MWGLPVVCVHGICLALPRLCFIIYICVLYLSCPPVPICLSHLSDHVCLSMSVWPPACAPSDQLHALLSESIGAAHSSTAHQLARLSDAARADAEETRAFVVERVQECVSESSTALAEVCALMCALMCSDVL